ncbi:hypothetical protein [uncultured Methylobacterium sp.]|uniref:hypothetical protein n=1 Tax=uncultured Methylobacterium sp. TaxID=157278 RepID=UPI0035CA0C43
MSRVPARMLRPAALAALPLVLLALAGSPVQAQRDDQGLQLGCANDYFRLCVGVDPSSPEADRCMTRNRKRLSPECRAAIGDYDRRTGSKSMQDD